MGHLAGGGREGGGGGITIFKYTGHCSSQKGLPSGKTSYWEPTLLVH